MAIGEIRMFAGEYAPEGWALCDGRDGKVPDMRGHAPMHFGNGVPLGGKGKITVDAGGGHHHMRTALNFIIALTDHEEFEPFTGEVRIFAANFAPHQWAFCDGHLLAIRSDTTLFSILGTAYGGDNIRSFALPNLKGGYPYQPNEAEGRGQTGGVQPYNEGAAPTPLFVVHYCICVQGIYPRRP